MSTKINIGDYVVTLSGHYGVVTDIDVDGYGRTVYTVRDQDERGLVRYIECRHVKHV
jgi:hypothetical protein